MIAEVASELDSSREDFVRAVKTGPPWARSQGFCQRALEALRDWRSRDLEYPPYVAYLAAFVLAAGLEGKFEPWAYHPRLLSLLGEDDRRGQLPSFDRMYKLWEDLELWAVRDKRGELGIFEVTFAGEMMHVGLPKAQALLTEAERRALPEIFAEADFDPASPPPPASRLAQALRRYGDGRLRGRTLARLAKPRDDIALYDILLETVGDELADWDGAVEVADGSGQQQLRGVLRLTLAIDRLAAAARVHIRVRVPRPLPEEGLQLEPGGLRAVEEVSGWSTYLEDASGVAVDASTFDWTQSVTYRDSALAWALRLPAYQARAFVSAEPYGLPNYVEADRLPERAPFYLAYHDEVERQISSWVEAHCDGFVPVRNVSGLPTGWNLAYVEHAESGLRDPRFPNLSAPDKLRLRLGGGIRVVPGRNEYFAFAPPVVVTEHAADAVPLCGGRALSQLSADVFALPAGLPAEERVEVTIATSEKQQKRLSLYLTSDFEWRMVEPRALVDRWGQATTPGDGEIAGAVPEVTAEPARWRRFPLLAAAGTAHAAGPFILLGRVPGEVARWPQAPLPKTWDPVWLLTTGRRHQLIYAGGRTTEATPARTTAGTRQMIDEWKEFTWWRRKRITPPREAELVELWREYEEVGKIA